MTVPEDISQTARRLTDGVDGWIGSIVGMQIIEQAILAERKRCAGIARSFTDTTPFAGEVIANEIEFGCQP